MEKKLLVVEPKAQPDQYRHGAGGVGRVGERFEQQGQLSHFLFHPYACTRHLHGQVASLESVREGGEWGSCCG